MITLIGLMLKEEFRMHASYSSKSIFLTFPLITAVFSFAAASASQRIFQYTPMDQVMLVLHASVFLYGLSVGAFGFLGRMYVERQYGYRNYLVTMPSLLPLSFRKTFLGLYIRDVLFYLSLMLLPMTAGLFLSIPLTRFNPLSILFVFLGTLLSFLLGISLSFFVSTLYVRNMVAFLFCVLAVVSLFAAHGIAHILPIEILMPALGFQFELPPFEGGIGSNLPYYLLESITLTLSFLSLAVLLIQEKFESRKSIFQSELPQLERKFSFFKNYQTLLAKEVVDLKRSGTIGKMFFSFVAPLLFLSFTAWFVRYGLEIPVGFNAVFYGAMVGFFGVLLYNWLNNVDFMDYYSTLPLTVPQVIKTKLVAFLILTIWISTIFVIVISWLNNDVSLLWLAIPVMFIVSIYMVVMTAYLTGLRTNSFLFNPSILLKFSAMSILPDVCLTILSFTIDKDLVFSAGGMGIVLIALMGTTFILYRGIEEKWIRTEFSE